MKARSQKLPKSYWKDPKNQRRFLDELVRTLKIENPSDWGKVTHKQVRAVEGGHMLLESHGGSLFRALKTAYPGRT